MSSEKLQIKILGTSTASQQMIVSVLHEFLKVAEISYEIIEETDVAVFIEEELVSVPAIQVNGKTISLPIDVTYSKGLRDAVNEVLKKVNYGNMIKIVIPVDFSDVSVNAFMYGYRIATMLGAVAKAVHVYYPSSQELTQSTVVDVDFMELRRSYLDTFVKKIDVDWGSDIVKSVLVDKEFRIGFPAEEILDSAEENAADLIVMGTTGDTARIKKWFGSVSSKVMNESSCPVLLVPENARYKGVKNIMYAFDDIDLDKSIVQKLVDISQWFDAKLHLVHVESDGVKDPGYFLKELIQKHYPDHQITLVAINSTDIVEGLYDYATSAEIDIISMATKNRSFFSSVFHQSITQRMALHSELPLLIFKS